MPSDQPRQYAAKRRTWVRSTLVAVGLALLVFTGARSHPMRVLAHVARVGWMFLPASACWVLLVLMSALAWREILDPSARQVPLSGLFRAFWVGAAVNDVTPTGAIGEVVKGTLLRGRIATKDLVSSLVLYNYVTGATVVCWSIFGLAVAAFLLRLPASVLVAAVGVAAAMIFSLVAFGVLLGEGVTSKLVRIGIRIPFIRFDEAKAEEQAHAVDYEIRCFRGQRPGSFFRAIGLASAARMAEVLEVAVLLAALAPKRGPGWIALFAVLVQSASQLLKYAVTFVPGQVGFLETGTALVFRIAGLGTAPGLALELLRRARKLLAFAVALALMARTSLRASKRHLV